jgi:hypothetical protein
VTVTLEIVTSEFPLLVTAVVNELLFPACTFPKSKLVGDAPSDSAAVVPSPVRESACGEAGALSVKAILPLTVLVDVGVNCTVKEML